MNDDFYSQVNDAYYGVIGAEAGVDYSGKPEIHKRLWELKKKFIDGDNDVINVVEYLNTTSNIVEKYYVAPYQPFAYTAYAKNPEGKDLQLNESITTHFFRLTVKSGQDFDYVRDAEFIKRLFDGKTFVQYVWPHYHYAYAEDLNNATQVHSNVYHVDIPERDVVGFGYVDNGTQAYVSQVVTYDFTPLYNEIGVEEFNDWSRRKWMNRYISYALDEDGTDRTWEKDETRLFFRSINVVLEDVAVPYPTDERLAAMTGYVQYLWPHELSGYARDGMGLVDFSPVPLTGTHFYRRIETFITDSPEPPDAGMYLSGAPFEKYIDMREFDFYEYSDGTQRDEDDGQALISGHAIEYKWTENDEVFYYDCVSSVIRQRYVVPSAFAENDCGCGLSLTPDPVNLYYRSSLDVVDVPGIPSCMVVCPKFFQKHNVQWEQYVDRGYTTAFQAVSGAELTPEDVGESSLFSGFFTHTFYIGTKKEDDPWYVSGECVMSAWLPVPIREHYTMTFYATDLSGSNASLEESKLEKPFRLDLDTIDDVRLTPLELLERHNDGWTQYVMSAEIDVFKPSRSIGDFDVTTERQDPTDIQGLSTYYYELPNEEFITGWVEWGF